MSNPVIFIVGVGRSGTSLLQSMFAAHPKVSCLPETSFIRRMILTGHLDTIYKTQGEDAAANALAIDKHFSRTGLDPRAILSRAVVRGGLLDAAVYLIMLDDYSSQERPLICDKDPRSIEFLSLLARVIPQAHVVHIFRDPRDVLLSKKKAAWSKGNHVWKHIFANRVQFYLGSKLGPVLFGHRYHEVCYETLLKSPELVLSKLCTDLGIEYNISMLSFGDAAKQLVSAHEMSWKKQTLGPLLTHNTNKWKAKLHNREIMLTELCCDAVLMRGGFAKENGCRPICAKDRLWVEVGRLFIDLATIPYEQYRTFMIRQACKRLR